MTIAAAYLAREGLVLGADSTTTYSFPVVTGGQPEKLERYLNHAQKVFEIGTSAQLALVTWGAGTIGELSHRTVAARIADMVGPDGTPEEAAEVLASIISEVLAARAGGNEKIVGYFVGGIHPVERTPQCFEIHATAGGDIEFDEMGIGECRFRGVEVFFTRVFYGFDPQFLEELKKALIAEGRTDIAPAFAAAVEKARAATMPAWIGDRPIREALDCVYSFLHITIKGIKFLFLPPMCGGPIEIGFMTTDRPFRWVNHKDFGTAIAEQELRR